MEKLFSGKGEQPEGLFTFYNKKCDLCNVVSCENICAVLFYSFDDWE